MQIWYNTKATYRRRNKPIGRYSSPTPNSIQRKSLLNSKKTKLVSEGNYHKHSGQKWAYWGPSSDKPTWQQIQYQQVEGTSCPKSGCTYTATHRWIPSSSETRRCSQSRRAHPAASSPAPMASHRHITPRGPGCKGVLRFWAFGVRRRLERSRDKGWIWWGTKWGMCRRCSSLEALEGQWMGVMLLRPTVTPTRRRGKGLIRAWNRGFLGTRSIAIALLLLVLSTLIYPHPFLLLVLVLLSSEFGFGLTTSFPLLYIWQQTILKSSSVSPTPESAGRIKTEQPQRRKSRKCSFAIIR